MDPSDSQKNLPVVPAESGIEYTVEYLSEITGIERQKILLYREEGMIAAADPDASKFDDQALHTLRRIEHLRQSCEMNLSGLKILASLLDEVEALRAELRARR